MPRNNSEQSTPAPPRRSRKLRVFVIGMIGFAALIFFLPVILISTPLKQSAIEMATADVNGTVEVNSISAGWFSPIKFEEVVVNDQQGTPILSVDQIQTSNTLFGFLTSQNLGSIEIIRPTINLVARADGSNLENVFANYISGEETSADTESSTPLPKIQIEIQDGLVQLSTPSIDAAHRLENINAVLECSGPKAPFAANIKCTAVPAQQTEPGEIVATVFVDEGQSDLVVNQVTAEVQAANLSVALLAPILNRILGPTNCDGQIDCDFTINANLNNFVAAADFRTFQGKNLAVVAPDYLGNDQFSAANLNAFGKLHISPDRIAADQFKAESEFARIKADGEFDFDQLSQLASGSEIPQAGFQLDGIVDLAQITSMLPETTRLRDGVKLDSGLIQLHANTRKENGAPRMVINADAANMNMIVDGQNINWHKPLRMAIVAAKKQNALVLENIELSSDFLNANGSAALDNGELSVAGDLRKLTRQIGQLIDLGGLNLSGDINGKLVWQTHSDAVSEAATSSGTIPIELRGQFRINNPDISIPGYQRWKEDAVDLSVVSNLNASSTGDVAIAGARFDVKLGDETAVGVLNQPIDDLFKFNKYQLQCQADGSLAKWLVQARHFAELPDFSIDGNLNSQFVFTLNPKSCRINQLQFQATDFVMNGFGLNVREPQLTGKANLKYDFATGKIEFSKSSLKANNAAVNTQQLTMDVTKKVLFDGVVGFKTSVNHVSNWLGMSLPGDSVRWDGIATGKMTFSSESGYFGGQLDANIKDLVVVQRAATVAAQGGVQAVSTQSRYEELWGEPRVRLSSQIDLADDFDALQLSNLQLDSKLADIRADGMVEDLAGTMRTDLSGQWNLKWANINQTLKDLIGDMVSFSGEGWQPILIRGPLFDATSVNSQAYVPPALQVTTSLAWNDVSLMSTQLGPGNVGVNVDQCVAQLSSQTSNGLIGQVLQLQPLLDLRTANPMFVMGQGKLLNQWQLTEEDSRTWIKYAAPLIADATSAQGKASVDMVGANVPLFDPLKASARGTLEIHELVVGAGPLAQQLLPLIDQIKAILKPGSSSIQDRTTWLQLRPQKIPVVVQEGKVFHENFEMSYKDLTIRTRGSVGFDQSMNLVAEIPILDEWIDDNRMLASLKGKTIPIAIGGTISQPRLDRGAITQLTSQLVRDTAINAAQEKVTGEVNKLQEKFGDKVQQELGKFQDKVNGKFENQLEDKLQGELRDGLNKLFGRDK